MMTMTITMEARPEKRKELLQTLSGLLPLLRKETGYRDGQVYMGLENINHLALVEVWNSRQDAERHMQSHYFMVLRGAMQLLTAASNVTFAQAPYTASMQVLFTGQCQECARMNECEAPMCLSNTSPGMHGGETHVNHHSYSSLG